MGQGSGNRRGRRIHVRDLTISLNGKTYRIFNINEYGLGFLIDSPEAIQIGAEIAPIIIKGNNPVRVSGIARHISQLNPSGRPLGFQSGWVCGLEFTARYDPGGSNLLRQYIAEIMGLETEDSDN
ncbi:MAG: hypothetical protein PVH26_07340 [Desulfosarcina sp.]|jgi:hypothetical protein